MTIGFRSLLPALVAEVRTALTARGVTASVEFGWRRAERQDNQGPGGANRVLFVPSRDDGDGGELAPPRFRGDRNVRDEDGLVVGTVRALADWVERPYALVWGRDPIRPEDEERQYEATRTLFEETMVALHGASGAFASVTFERARWTPPATRTFGREVRLEFSIRNPVFFPARELVYPAGVAVGRGVLSLDPETAVGGDT